MTKGLAPTLQLDEVLGLNNLSVHKLFGMVDWLTERGVEVFFLPPYSPNFSPVEQASTRQASELTLQQAIGWITSADSRKWVDHCDYYTQRA